MMVITIFVSSNTIENANEFLACVYALQHQYLTPILTFFVIFLTERPDWIFPGIFTLSAAGVTLLLPVFQVI